MALAKELLAGLRDPTKIQHVLEKVFSLPLGELMRVLEGDFTSQSRAGILSVIEDLAQAQFASLKALLACYPYCYKSPVFVIESRYVTDPLVTHVANYKYPPETIDLLCDRCFAREDLYAMLEEDPASINTKILLLKKILPIPRDLLKIHMPFSVHGLVKRSVEQLQTMLASWQTIAQHTVAHAPRGIL